MNGADFSYYSPIASATTSPAPAFLYVDYRNNGSENSTLQHPYQTVLHGYQHVVKPTVLKIQAGTYPETFLLNKVLRLEPMGGTVLIQKP